MYLVVPNFPFFGTTAAVDTYIRRVLQAHAELSSRIASLASEGLRVNDNVVAVVKQECGIVQMGARLSP